MNVCVYVCMHVCMYVCMCVNMFLYMYANDYTYTYIILYIDVYIYIYAAARKMAGAACSRKMKWRTSSFSTWTSLPTPLKTRNRTCAESKTSLRLGFRPEEKTHTPCLSLSLSRSQTRVRQLLVSGQRTGKKMQLPHFHMNASTQQ